MPRPGTFVVTEDKGGGWYWNLVASNGEVLFSGESYTRKDDAVEGAETAREAAARAQIIVMPERRPPGSEKYAVDET
jgi:uncharacterized protein YegP (UPF0339 family)